MKTAAVLAAFLLTGILAAADAPSPSPRPQLTAAWSVDPFETTIQPGRRAKVAYLIVNRSDRAIPISTRIMTRDIDGVGTERNSDCPEDFIVTPVQITVPPHGRRTIRVHYVGPTVPVERAYRFLVEEVAVQTASPQAADATSTQGRINILLRFNCRLFVAPPDARPAPAIESWKVADGRLELMLTNPGKAHATLGELVLKVSTPDGEHTLPITAPGILLAGRSLRLAIPLPARLATISSVALQPSARR